MLPTYRSVIPAKAGTQLASCAGGDMGPRLRGDDTRRWSMTARALTLAAALFSALNLPAHATSFPDFLHAFEPTAVASGVSPTVYELSTAGLTPDPTIKTLVET